VQVYVVVQDNFAEFITYLQSEHFHLAYIPEVTVKEGILEEYESEIEKRNSENERRQEQVAGHLSEATSKDFWG
jgi:hypothetical protein